MRTPPDPSAFSGTLEKALAVLALEREKGRPWCPATQVARVLRDQFGISAHWRTLETELLGDRQIADRRKRQRSWEFFLMDKGWSLIEKGERTIQIVDPAKSVRAISSLHQLMSTMSDFFSLAHYAIGSR